KDMGLIREILLAIEAKEDLHPRELVLPDHDADEVGAHVDLLHRAGFIRGPDILTNAKPYAQVLVIDLTWDGHEFLAALKTEGVWEKIKAQVTPEVLAVVPITMVRDGAMALAREWFFQKIGLKP